MNTETLSRPHRRVKNYDTLPQIEAEDLMGSVGCGVGVRLQGYEDKFLIAKLFHDGEKFSYIDSGGKHIPMGSGDVVYLHGRVIYDGDDLNTAISTVYDHGFVTSTANARGSKEHKPSHMKNIRFRFSKYGEEGLVGPGLSQGELRMELPDDELSDPIFIAEIQDERIDQLLKVDI